MARDTLTAVRAGHPAVPAAEPVRTRGVGLLAAGLAHDLNNMLGGIVATAELVQLRVGTQPGTAETLRDLGAIMDQATRAGDLIRKILAFSRQDTLVPVTADIDDLLDGFMTMLDALIFERAALQRLRGPGMLVRIDPAALERSVVNLVLNARDAIARRRDRAGRGQIRISVARIAPALRPEPGRAFMPAVPYAAVRVEDNGPGVAAADRARMFDPYFTTRPDGQGLGLATAFGLVKQSGGFLLYDPSPLGGARFTIYLPEASPERPADGGAGAPDGHAILLVEDDPMQRMATARALERLGHRVFQAANAEAALARIELERPLLLLTDIRLPGMDGLELTRRARALYPGVPVLLISGYVGEQERALLPELDAAFLGKPFTLKTLTERLGELLHP